MARKKQQMQTVDSICPLTERQHVTIPVSNSTLRQCEACQDLFDVQGQHAESVPDEQNRPESAPLTDPAPEVLGQVRVDPEANTERIELTPAGLRTLGEEVIREFSKTDLGTDIPHMIAFTMVGVAYLKHMGMGHNEIMQVVSIAFNGDVTGLFVLGFDPSPESGDVPE